MQIIQCMLICFPIDTFIWSYGFPTSSRNMLISKQRQDYFLWLLLRQLLGQACGCGNVLWPICLPTRWQCFWPAWWPLFVANMLANGALPGKNRMWFGAAFLGGLAKPDGGVRPIAAGEVLRRWVGRAMLTQDRDELASFFLSHHQVGVGVQAGADIASRVVDLALAAFDDENAAALFDCANAFFPSSVPKSSRKYDDTSRDTSPISASSI